MKRLAVAFAFLICLFALATANATNPRTFYDVEGGPQDSGGNGHDGSEVGTPVYSSGSAETVSPLSIYGDYEVKIDDSNYITVPATAMPVGANGSIAINVFWNTAAPDISLQVHYDIATSSRGRFAVEVEDANTWGARIPTTSGGEFHTSSFHFRKGRWYRLLVTANATNYAMLVRDARMPAGVWETTSAGSLASAFNPSGAISGVIGKYVYGDGYHSTAFLDAAATTDFYLPNGDDDYLPAAKPEYIIGMIGASHMEGACAFPAQVGFRYPLQNLELVAGRNVYFDGIVDGPVGGALIAAGCDAFGGSATPDFFPGGWHTDITTILQRDFPTPTANDVIVVGGDLAINDWRTYSYSTTKTAQGMDALINSINAYSSDINILVTTGYRVPVLRNSDYDARAATVKDAYDRAKVRGVPHMFMVDPWVVLGNVDGCDDGLHPVESAHADMAALVYGALAAVYDPTTTPTATPSSTATPSATPTFTPTATPTFTISPTFTVTPTRTPTDVAHAEGI